MTVSSSWLVKMKFSQLMPLKPITNSLVKNIYCITILANYFIYIIFHSTEAFSEVIVKKRYEN